MNSGTAEVREALDGKAYDWQWARIDDFILYHPGARHRRRIIFNLINRTKANNLLDVGCGNGELISLIHGRFPTIQLHGVDLSPAVIEENRQRFPYCNFEVLDIESESLHRQYELVVTSEVIEHLNDRSTALKNMARMVRPGGHLLISSPAGRVFETERRWGHTTHPTARELSEFASTSGLRIEYLANWGFPVYYALKFATNINADWAMNRFGNGAYSNMQRALCDFLYKANFLNLPNSAWGCQLFCLLRKTEV